MFVKAKNKYEKETLINLDRIVQIVPGSYTHDDTDYSCVYCYDEQMNEYIVAENYEQFKSKVLSLEHKFMFHA